MSKALLGSRISLVSLKDIRYEGILYSINEQDATVALQDVRSFGTEGREKAEAGGSGAFVPAADAVHPYLLFRGCDIKDLHVHESQEKEERPAPPEDPAIVSTEVPEAVQRQQQARADREAKRPEAGDRARRSARGGRARSGGGGGGEREGQPRERKPRAAVGTGADLLGRKARGTVDGAGPQVSNTEFDFQAGLAKLDITHGSAADDDGSDDDDDGGGGYSKDGFFDAISSDVSDRAAGKDVRLRGAAERQLNTETFGATSLGGGNGRRRGGRNRRRGGRGRGRGQGAGGGRGRGGERGGGRGGGYGQPAENSRWN